MQRVLIAGDRTVDRFFYSQPARDTGENWQLAPSTREFYLPGGVLLLVVPADLRHTGLPARICDWSRPKRLFSRALVWNKSPSAQRSCVGESVSHLDFRGHSSAARLTHKIADKCELLAMVEHTRWNWQSLQRVARRGTISCFINEKARHVQASGLCLQTGSEER
jgi:hypothetical protein